MMSDRSTSHHATASHLHTAPSISHGHGHAASSSSKHHFSGHEEAAMKLKDDGTAGKSAKSDKSQATDLKKSVTQLQKEADQQLELEMETQMTLEHFLGQMIR